jgi:SAM-dependent methyltransferase
MSSSQLATDEQAAGTSGHYSGSSDQGVWFRSHYEQAAGEVVEFFGGDGISLKGKRVADVGCGDGITDLGLVARAEPALMVGFDIVETDRSHLAALAAEAGVGYSDGALPETLEFTTSSETGLPAEDQSFDYVLSWSAFEHILEPVPVLREIRRILTDEGVLFIQLWPFYDSAHGTHLVDWFPEGFAQYRYSDEEILSRMQAGPNPDAVPGMYEAYRTLNRITADQLFAALRAAGFRVVKLQLQADAVHVPEQARDLPPSRVGISGIKLLAVKDSGEPATLPATLPATRSFTQRARSYGLRTVRRGLQRADHRLSKLQP